MHTNQSQGKGQNYNSTTQLLAGSPSVSLGLYEEHVLATAAGPLCLHEGNHAYIMHVTIIKRAKCME